MAYPGSARYPGEAVSPAPLAQPLRFEFSGKTAPNRFLKGAMSERLATWDLHAPTQRGIPKPELIEVYRRWGEGGFGLTLSGNVMLDYGQLEAPGNMIVPLDAPFSGPRFDAFAAMARAIQVKGGLAIAQVSHPGRQVSDTVNSDPISASDVQLKINMFGNTFAKPHPASQAEIDDIIDRFAHAAEYLHHAGWDGIQLHGAHGYLLAQFLSQTTNLRTDKYGGPLVQRARIIVEIAAAIRKRVPKTFSVGIKMNSVEFQEKGFTPEEAKELVKILEANEFDFVELSGGTYESTAFFHARESTKKRESFFIEWAEAIAPELKRTKVYVTGGFRTTAGMVEALKTVDGVGLARPATQEPRLPNDIISGKVHGVVQQQFDPDNFGITNCVAGTQILQIGEGKEPMDGSKVENVQAFQEDLGAWMAAMQASKGEQTGFVTLNKVPQVPYGTAAPAAAAVL